MKVIHKITLAMAARIQTFQLPEGSVIRAVQAQNDLPTVWYECDPELPPTARHFVIVGTGHTLPDISRLLYLGTVQQMGGALIWHVYEALS